MKKFTSLLIFNPLLDLEIKTFSQVLAHNYKPGIAIWSTLRAVDLAGKQSGNVGFSITQMAQALEMTKTYLRKVLKICTKVGIFRSMLDTDNPDIKKVYLASIKEIVKNQHAESRFQKLGTTGYCSVVDLRNPMRVAVHLETQSLQKQSHFLSTQEHQKVSQVTNLGLAPSYEYFNYIQLDPSVFKSDGAIGIYGYNEKYRTLFTSGKFKAYGVAQKTVAERLGISVGTVYSHLQDIEQVRIAKADMTSCVEREIEYEDMTGLRHFIKVNSLSICDNVRALGKVFKFLPSIYNLNYVLAKPRCLERKIKRAVDAYNQSSHPLQTNT